MTAATPELDPRAALAALAARHVPISDTRRVAVAAAAGCVLAEDVVAPIDLPAFANAAMDGYAVRSSECAAGVVLSVVGTALAGHPFTQDLGAGSAVRIMTGAAIPAMADAVVMQEDTQRSGDRVTLAAPVLPSAHIRPRGQHVRAGDRLMCAGTLVRAAEIGLATAVGLTELTTYRPLHVGLASTGDELVDPPALPDGAGSYDANRPMLVAACRSAGFVVTDFGVCPDRADAFAQLLARAGEHGVDALVISGGSAMGDADVVRKADRVEFIPVAIRPGRGITSARVSGPRRAYAMLGLPGNAVAAFVMFHLVALPLLRRLGGSPHADVPLHVPVALAQDVRAQGGRTDYQRGRFEHDAAGRLTVRPLVQQGSAMVRTLVDADALIAVGPQAHYPAGTPIPVVPLDALPG